MSKRDFMAGYKAGRGDLFQEYQLDSFLGDSPDDYDIDAIIDEATYIDYQNGNRYWRDDMDLNDIAERNLRRFSARRRHAAKRNASRKKRTMHGGVPFEEGITAEFYTPYGEIVEVTYRPGVTVGEIAADLRENYDDWDCATLIGPDGEDMGVIRKTGSGKMAGIVVNPYGDEIDYEAAIQMMDDDLREEVHGIMAPCSEQEFFDAYCKAHERRFGEPWFLDEQNPVW